MVGILADKVYDVTDIEGAAIEDAPRVGMRWRPDYVRGIGKRQNQFIIIPDLQRIFENEGRKSTTWHADERAAFHFDLGTRHHMTLGLKGKLGLGFGLLIVMICGLGGYSLLQMDGIDRRSRRSR